MLYKTLRLLDDHFSNLDVTLSWLIERGADHLSPNASLHVCHFLGTLVDQKNNQVRFLVILSNRVRDILEQYRLTRTGRSHNQ